MMRLRAFWGIASCVGVLTPFLPFAGGVSPLRAVGYGAELAVIAGPFFLAILVPAAWLRAEVFHCLPRGVLGVLAVGSSSYGNYCRSLRLATTLATPYFRRGRSA